MNLNLKEVSTLAVIVSLASSHAVLAQSELRATLQAPQIKAQYLSTEALNIDLSDIPSDELLQGIALEVDNIDVTELASLNGTRITYTPVSRLSFGKHQVRLVHYAKDGAIIEIGYWQIEVHQSENYRAAQLRGATNIEFSRRLVERSKPDADFGEQSQVLMGGQYQTVLAKQSWLAEGSASLSYVDDARVSLTGRELDIPQFHLYGEAGNLHFNIGDHLVAETSLLYDGHRRRGVSADYTFTRLRSRIQMFQSSSQQVVGLDAGVGISDGDNQLEGGEWQFQPIHSERTQLSVTAGVVSGRVLEDDFATYNAPNFSASNIAATPEAGEAWNVSIDASLFYKRLRLRLENAESRYDFDGIDQGFEEEEDRAVSALAVLSSKAYALQAAKGWSLGVEHKKVGSYFRSIAHRDLPADTEHQRVFTNGAYNAWTWNASYAMEENNLDENQAYAKTDTRQWTAGASYQNNAPTLTRVFAILGRPTLSWFATGVDIKDASTPAGFFANNVKTETANVTALFAKPKWTWSAIFNQDNLEDRSAWQPDTLTRSGQLNANIQAGQYYSFTLGWQLQHTLFKDQDLATQRQLFSIEAKAALVPNTLNAYVNIGSNRANALEDPFFAMRDSSRYVNTNIAWQVKKPRENSAGLNLVLSYSQNTFKDRLNVFNNFESRQLNLKISTTLPTSYPGNSL